MASCDGEEARVRFSSQKTVPQTADKVVDALIQDALAKNGVTKSENAVIVSRQTFNRYYTNG